MTHDRATTCGDCGQTIIWGIGGSGMHIPMDPPGRRLPTIAYQPPAPGQPTPTFRALAAKETARPGETFTTSHWATCPGPAAA